MKNISLLLNAVLAVAVAFLFYLQFSGNATPEMVEEEPAKADTLVANEMAQNLPSELKICYVNSDSLWTHYKLKQQFDSDFRTEKLQSETKLKNDVAKLENEVLEAQKGARYYTQAQVLALESEFKEKEKNLMIQSQNLEEQLMKSEQMKYRELNSKLDDFLTRYCEERGYTYVLSVQTLGSVLYGNPALDITREVIDGLNKEYDEMIAAKKAEAATKK